MVGTGYDCSFWLERDVNGTGWYDESGQTTLSPGNDFISQNYWDGSGYEALACFEFLWSGTSDPRPSSLMASPISSSASPSCSP
jgi:hypothetical protein